MALIETFSDDFTDLSNWTVIYEDDATTTAAGQLTVTVDATTSNASNLVSVGTYDFNESWSSIKIVDIFDVDAVNGMEIWLGAVAPDFSVYTFTRSGWYKPGGVDTLFFSNSAFDFSLEIPMAPQPYHIGFTVISGMLDAYYSFDDGVTWVHLYTEAYVGPADPAEGLLIINATGRSGAAGTYDMLFDDYNVLEPNVGTGPSAIEISFDVAEVTVDAIPHDSITLGDPYVSFTPATVSVLARAPLSVVLGEPAPVIDVLPAQVNVVPLAVEPIVGDFVPGDRVESAIIIRESGSTTVDMTDSESVWFAYQADSAMTITLTTSGSGSYTMTVYNGTGIDNFTVDSTGHTIVTDVVTGLTYILIQSSDSDSISFSWAYDTVANDLMMDVLTPNVERTPDTLRVSVIGGAAGEQIRFTWSPPVSTLIPGGTARPITLATVSSDFEGNIYTASLPVQAAPAGTYIVEARGVTSGRHSVGTFTIDFAPLTDSSDTGSEPVESMSIKWLWDDGVADPWIMTNNPDRMTSPIKVKALTPERTTSGTGQHVIWQGATPAIDWSFTGVIFTEADRELLEYYYGLNRKFYITTHRNVRYTVTMKSLEMTPKRNGDNFETWDYTATLYIFTETPVKKTLSSRWKVLHL